MATIEVCQGESFSLYTNVNNRFKFDAFEGYNALMNIKHSNIIMCYIAILNTNVEHLDFEHVIHLLFMWICKLAKQNLLDGKCTNLPKCWWRHIVQVFFHHDPLCLHNFMMHFHLNCVHLVFPHLWQLVTNMIICSFPMSVNIDIVVMCLCEC